jgi:CRP/FNR family cyclic AMP-dependent transcriptional regulator
MTGDDRDPESLLAAIDLFNGLSPEQVRKLVDRGRLIPHQTGRQLTSEGDHAHALHVILKGRATVTVAGSEVRTIGSGDYFGEISMIDGKPRSATVTATEPMTTLTISHTEFQRLLTQDPDFGRRLLTSLCARLRDVKPR